MRKKMVKRMSRPILLALAAISAISIMFLVSAVPASAASNIVPGAKFSWSENAGWTNWSPTSGGAWVAGTGLVGYLWQENIGWIKLGSDGGPPYANTSAADWGVNNDEHGNLSGYAWSVTTGWVNFSPGASRATIDVHGNFSGYAWGENIGWIALSGNISSGGTYVVKTTWKIDETPPTITALKQDNNPLIAGDLLALRPEITTTVTDTESGVNPSTLIVYIDGTAVTDGTASGGHYDSYDVASGLLTYAFKSDISSGSHSLKIEAKDMAANKGELELANLQVNTELMITNVLIFPNPASGFSANLSFQLSQASSNVGIKIYDLNGSLIKSIPAGSCSPGFNKITFDTGDMPNGSYFGLVTAQAEAGSCVGKGKFSVLH